jgi:hypothetical protein
MSIQLILQLVMQRLQETLLHQQISAPPFPIPKISARVKQLLRLQLLLQVVQMEHSLINGIRKLEMWLVQLDQAPRVGH